MRTSRVLSGLFLVSALVLLSCAAPASQSIKSNEPYKIGVTATLTGPSAQDFTPTAEGLRIYFDDLNDRGGIDGHAVQLMIEDDRLDAGLAGSNAKKFVESGVQAIVISSQSRVYEPVIAEAKRANIPVFTAIVAPQQAMPPNADKVVFALLQMGLNTVSRAAVETIAKLSTTTPYLGVVTVDSPVGIALAEDAVRIAPEKGMKATYRAVPPTTLDYTAVADEFLSLGVNWAYGEAGTIPGKMLYEALKRRGYQGSFLGPYDDPSVLQERKDPKMYTLRFNSQPIEADIPETRAIRAAAEKYHAEFVNGLMVWGWTDGRLLEVILKKSGWPATTEKMVAAMNSLEFDGRPLQAPTKWSANDHIGWVYWGTYGWDAANSKVIPALDWSRVSPDGKTVESVGDLSVKK